MAKISLILFVTVLTVPSVLMSKVSNQTQRLRSTVNNDLAFTATDCPGVDDVSQRNQFLQYFIGNQMPTGLFTLGDPKVLYLCQTDSPDYPTRSYYSTIFDKTTINAILSAYSVAQEEALRIGGNPERANYWKSSHHDLFSRPQYENWYRHDKNAENYQKGHLLPFSIYSFDENYGKSTFDYSNAVPQRAEWNQGDWKSFEKAIKRYTQLSCGCRYRGKMYLLTGTSQFYMDPWSRVIKKRVSKMKIATIPKGKKKVGRSKKIRKIKKIRKGKKIMKSKKISITIPKAMWTAGCCIWNDPKSGKEKVQSIAVIGNNLPKTTQTMATKVSQLQLWLANRHGPVKLFPGKPACSYQRNSYIL